MFLKGNPSFDVTFESPEGNFTRTVQAKNETIVDGLLPGTPYNATVVAYDPNGVVIGESKPQPFRTGMF